MQKQKSKLQTPAEQIIYALETLNNALAEGGLAEVEKQFRVTRVIIPPLKPADVARIRKQIGATQLLLASLLGVEPSIVRAWERGAEAISPMAEKFLNEMRYNGDYWRQRVAAVSARAKPHR